MKTIAVVGTLDTKGEECELLKDSIEKRGFNTLVVDVGILGEPFFKPDITGEDVAIAGGASIGDLRAERDRGKAVRIMGKGKKIFCIGRNKTGKKALENIGVGVGHQRPGELLIHDWARGDFRRLFMFCRTAQVFQDMPFSLPFTCMVLDKKFRESKFILPARDSSGQ